MAKSEAQLIPRTRTFVQRMSRLIGMAQELRISRSDIARELKLSVRTVDRYIRVCRKYRMLVINRYDSGPLGFRSLLTLLENSEEAPVFYRDLKKMRANKVESVI